MSTELTTIRSSIKARLDTISGLSNHKSEPDAIPSLPFTILGNCEIDYNTDMGGGRDFNFRLLVCVAEQDSERGWVSLDSFLAAAGTSSLKAALEGESVGAPKVGDFCHAIRAENTGYVAYRGRVFIGAELVVKVQSGG